MTKAPNMNQQKLTTYRKTENNITMSFVASGINMLIKLNPFIRQMSSATYFLHSDSMKSFDRHKSAATCFPHLETLFIILSRPQLDIYSIHQLILVCKLLAGFMQLG